MRRTILPSTMVPFALFMMASLPVSWAQEDLYLETGMLPHHVFDVAGFDSIDVLNGNLHFEQPLYAAQLDSGLRYQLKLSYNSTVWHWHANQDLMLLGSRSPAGLGFSLHMGRIYGIADPDPGQGPRWHYEDPSGTRHRLKPEVENGIKYYWSQDSTYIRARDCRSGCGTFTGWELWLPDGTKYEMAHEVTIGSSYLPNLQGWYTTRISSPVLPSANWVRVQYDPNNPACIAQITDSTGRTITFSNASTLLGKTIPGGYTQSVTVPAFGGRIAVYTFNYTLVDVKEPIDRGFRYPDELVLTQLVLPEGGLDLSFTYADPNTGKIEGGITTVTFGLGGGPPPKTARAIYDYTAFLPPENGRILDFQIEVKRKTLEPAEGGSYVWEYHRSNWGPLYFDSGPSCEHIYRVKTDIRDPYGNETRYRFTGTPRPVSDTTDDCYLDCSFFACLGGLPELIEYYGGAIQDGRLLREEWRFYTWDRPQDPVFGRNIRLGVSDVIYRDARKVVRVLNTGWDGMHWRESEEYDVFSLESDGSYPEAYPDANTIAERKYRVRRTEYEMPAVGSTKWNNWVMDTFTAMEIKDASGQVKSRTQYVFEDDGRIGSTRELVNPAGPSAAGDLLTTYEYDPNTGNLTGVTYEAPGVESTGRRMLYTYQGGYRASTRWDGFSWKEEDSTIDPNTGLVAESRDTAGIATSFQYDLLGRPTEVLPAAPETPTRLSYPSALETVVEQGDTNSQNYIMTRSVSDSLGRVILEEKLDEAGGLLKRVSTYDGPAPRLAGRSEWVAASTANPRKTTYSYFVVTSVSGNLATGYIDPFGRPMEVRAADDSDHVTKFGYYGPNWAESIQSINGDPNQVATTSYYVDAFGRLEFVFPPEPAAKAEYRYDFLDNLTEIRMGSQFAACQPGPLDPNCPIGPVLPPPGDTPIGEVVAVQRRLRTHDALGRLLSATEPESGLTTYGGYGGLGNLLQMTQADGSIFDFTYDAAGRRTLTSMKTSATAPSVLQAESVYDEGPATIFGASAGKLTTERSYDDTGVLVVTKRYTYSTEFPSGLNGRLSRKTTSFPDWTTSGVPVEIASEIIYDTFGRVATITYPLDAGSVRAPTQVTNGYSRGRLVSVNSNRGPILTSMVWNPAGGLSGVTSANGVLAQYPPDFLNRPSRVLITKGATTYFDSGTFSYDGAGNIRSIGADSYTYDLAGRLTAATVSANGYSTGVYWLGYGYDPFGNMTSASKTFGQTTETRTFGVDPNTNWLTSVNGQTLPPPDPKGTLLSDGSMTLGWDMRSRLAMVGQGGQTVGRYLYDSGGMRVHKREEEERRTTYQLRGGDGRLLTEYSKPSDSSLEPHWNRDYIYAAGSLVAVVQNAEPLEPAWRDSSASASAVHLVWAPNAEADLYGYNVYRTTTPGSGHQRLNNNGPLLTTSFDDMSPPPAGTPTYYVVTAVDVTINESRNSAERLITPGDLTAPNTPEDLFGSAFVGWVDLRWSANTEVDMAGYDVYRSTTSTAAGGTFAKLNAFPVTGTSYADSGVTGGTRYYYKIKAADTASNRSGFSSEISVTPTSGGPGCGGCPPQLEASLQMPWGCAPDSAACPNDYRLIGSHSPTEDAWYVLFVHGDHLGSIRAVTDPNGDLVSSHHYFPFGEEMPPIEAGPNPRHFAGHELDEESGLHYMLARPYHKGVGRFAAPDPGDFGSPGNPLSWNRYSYVLNSPVTLTDPYGLFWTSDGRLSLRDIVSRAAGIVQWSLISDAMIGSFFAPPITGTPTGGIHPYWVRPGGAPCVPPWCTWVEVTPPEQGLEDGASDLWLDAATLGGGILGKALIKKLTKEAAEAGAKRAAQRVVPRIPRSVGAQGNVFRGSKITNELAETLGIERRQLGKAVEQIKRAAGLRGNENVMINRATGDVFDSRTEEFIGNVFDELIK